MSVEPKDIAVHVGIAGAATLLLSLVLNAWAVAAVVSLVFFVREGLQRSTDRWKVWKWGPHSLSESIAPSVAAFLVAAVLGVL